MLDSSDTLWRYMKLSSFLLLLEGKAWFPSVASLRAGDPLEAALVKDRYTDFWGAIHQTGEKERISEWLYASLPEVKKKLLADNSIINDQVLGDEFAGRMAALRAAWCWFQSDLESAAMWSIYGHQGVAVQTNWKCLQNALPKNIIFRIDNMVYLDRRPCADRSITNVLSEQPNLILRPYFLKAIEYKHEKEVRVVAHCPDGANGRMVTGINHRLLIREVLISPLLPADEAEAVAKFIRLRSDAEDFSINRSTLIGGNSDSGFERAMEEHLFGTTDDNIDTTILPPCLTSL